MTMTPLDALDNAVHDFAAASGRPGQVGQWVLSFETSRVQVENPGATPLVHGVYYSVGPATSPATAAGLCRSVAALAESHLVDAMRALRDDDA